MPKKVNSPRSVVSNLDDIGGTSDKEGEEKTMTNDHDLLQTGLEEKKKTIVFSSYGLFLVSDQKQVWFGKNPFSHPSPLKSMKLVSYDSYPIYLGKDESLIEVEVRKRASALLVCFKVKKIKSYLIHFYFYSFQPCHTWTVLLERMNVMTGT